MKIIKLRKKNGKFRTIYKPSLKEKLILRGILGDIQKKVESVAISGVVHGFIRKKSPVTNAIQHVGHRYTLSFDLKDFFDTVTKEKLSNKLNEEQLKLVLVDGAARQGLPTSPAVANIAATSLDRAILSLRDKRKLQFIYTRYADDLSFSFDDYSIKDILLMQIPQIVKRCGFKLNESKTKWQTADFGRRNITGVAVDDTVHPTRKMKRKLRAAIHQNRKNEAIGLNEWCKCKIPSEKEVNKFGDELRTLIKSWKLGRLPLEKLPKKSDNEELGNSCIVTNDPVYMLGMSTFTTGWTSCMAHPSGQFRRGTIFWMFMRGSRIAAYIDHKTKICYGIERPKMKARALVHELRNGIKVYDRLYGNVQDMDVLRSQLEQHGYMSIQKARNLYKGVKVVGHAPATWRAYFDNLYSSTSKASSGVWKNKLIRSVNI